MMRSYQLLVSSRDNRIGQNLVTGVVFVFDSWWRTGGHWAKIVVWILDALFLPLWSVHTVQTGGEPDKRRILSTVTHFRTGECAGNAAFRSQTAA